MYHLEYQRTNKLMKIEQVNIYIPKVTLDETNHTAVVRVAIWNDWDGLTYFSRKIHWKNGKVSFNKPKKEKQLIKYYCGICF